MRKFLRVVFTLVLIIMSSSLCLACDKNEDKDYKPELVTSYSNNGFEVMTTSDFQLVQSYEGLNLKSEGDDLVSFGDTYINFQAFTGNSNYDFLTTTLKQYESDIALVEGVTLENVQDVVITEKFSDSSTGKLFMNMYVVDEMQNPNGNWDYYSIYFFAKASSSFIFINVYTSIQDEFFEDNILKLKTIVESVKFTQPRVGVYNETTKSYMSQTIAKTQDVFAHWGFEISVSNDYLAYVNKDYISGNHLQTRYTLEEFWSSRVSCSNLASFLGNAILEDDGVKHFVKFSTKNYLGFYTKSLNNDGSLSYKVYYLDNNNKLSVNYIKFDMDCSDGLDALNFKIYFEEQMINWIQSIEFFD